MTSNNRLVSNHVVGRGVKLAWAEDVATSPPEKATDNGTGTNTARNDPSDMVITVWVESGMDPGTTRAKFDEWLSLLNAIDRNLNGQGFRLKDVGLDETTGVHRFSLSTLATCNDKVRLVYLGKLLERMVQGAFGSDAVRVDVCGTNTNFYTMPF